MLDWIVRKLEYKRDFYDIPNLGNRKDRTVEYIHSTSFCPELVLEHYTVDGCYNIELVFFGRSDVYS